MSTFSSINKIRINDMLFKDEQESQIKEERTLKTYKLIKWNVYFFIQSFIWPLARNTTPEETITIELRQQTTKILFKSGTSSSSTSGSSRGTIASSSKIIGQYVMLVQGELTKKSLNVSECFRNLLHIMRHRLSYIRVRKK